VEEKLNEIITDGRRRKERQASYPEQSRWIDSEAMLWKRQSHTSVTISNKYIEILLETDDQESVSSVHGYRCIHPKVKSFQSAVDDVQQ
jgi:hypothetical protein